jgi:hypothetical protein
VGRVRINPEEVVHETVDGEVILIALQTGCYYSLEGSGAEVWAGLLDGRRPEEVVAELEARYAAERGVIRTAVLELVERLVRERLIDPEEDEGDLQGADLEPAAASSAAPFPLPVFHKFTDMQDFLLVDPIHEVGEAGWPHSPAVR